MSNEPAFPLDELNQANGDVCAQHFGLTMRDYFAAKAMQGWVSSYPTNMEAGEAKPGAHIIADLAYAIADAMLKARALPAPTTGEG